MDWVSTPEVRRAALLNERGALLNSIKREAKFRRLAEVDAILVDELGVDEKDLTPYEVPPEFADAVAKAAPVKKTAPKKVGA
jgi:hypothetical protein